MGDTDVSGSPSAAPRTLTPSSMAAVTVPLSLDERIASLESYVASLKLERPKDLANIRAEIAAIKLEAANEKSNREQLSIHVASLETKVDSLALETAAQTPILKAILKAVDTPIVRKLGLSILASVAIILGTWAAWLKGHADGASTTPSPPAIVTVYLPSSAAPFVAPKGSQ